MKVADLISKDVVQLQQQLLDLRKEQFNLRMQIASGNNTNTALLRFLRKDVARVLTLINQKKTER